MKARGLKRLDRIEAIVQVGNIVERKSGFCNAQEGRVYNPNGLCPSVRCDCQGRYWFLLEWEFENDDDER